MSSRTARREKFRRIIRQGRHPNYPEPEPPCHLCGQPIDYEAHHLHPLSFTIDHIVPRAHTGDDADVLENIAPAHRRCNREKSDRADWAPVVTYVTDRCWTP